MVGLAMGALVVWAATLIEPFTTASNYTVSDSGKIEVAGGVAKLKVQRPYHLHDTKTEFDATGAVYTDSEFHTGDVGSNQSGVKTGDSGLVAYYPLNGATGAIANLATAGLEDTKSTNEGTAGNANGTGMAFAASKFGNGVSFDGVDDYVDMNDVVDIGTENFSVSAWIKTTAQGNFILIVTKRNGYFQGNVGYNLFIHPTTNVIHFELADGTNEAELVSGMNPKDGNWHHIVAVINRSSLTNSFLYVDGSDNTNQRNYTMPTGSLGNATSFNIGGQNDSAGLSCLIDDVAVYNTALTASQVAAQYSAGAAVHMKASASLAPHAPKLSAGYPGLVAYWPLDHASGTVAADMAGANKGTLNSFPASPWVAGVNGNALTFDGTDDYVVLGSIPNLTGDVTLSAWVKSAAALAGTDLVLGSWISAGANTIGLFWYDDFTTTGIKFLYGNAAASSWASASNTYNNGAWHHVSGVRKGSTTYLYVDGTQVATGTAGALSAGTTFHIGAGSGGTTFPLNGTVDEAAIFNRALSANEIAYLAGKKGETATYTGPVMDGEIAAAKWDKLTMGTAGVKTTPNFAAVSVETALGDVVVSLPADLDGDGDLDIVASSGSLYGVKWYDNNGTGTFGAAQTITGPNSSYGIAAADFDGDGDNDIAGVRNAGNEVYWVANTNGLGTTWGTVTVIQSAFNAAHSIVAADFDGDGDMDVAATSGGTGNEVAWWANNGTGTFGAKQTIQAGFTAASGITATDLDGDGDQDVVAASDTTGNEVACWINNGSGTFGAKITIQSAFIRPQYVTAADLDGDGDQDVVATAFTGGDEVARWLNTNGLGTSWSAKLSIQTGFTQAEKAAAADLDGDGDQDIVAASYGLNEVAWWANDGAGGFGAKQSIRTGFANPFGVGVGDLNGDGLVDVAATAYTLSDVEAFLNTPWKDTSLGLNSNSYSVSRLSVGDIDGDGDLDFAIGSGGTSEDPEWGENNGSASFTIRDASVADNTNTKSVALGDLDKDGDLDIVAWTTQGLNWQQNGGGAPISWTDRVVDASPGSISNLWVGDVNKDGNNDVLYAFYEATGGVFWYQSDGAAPPAWTKRTVAAVGWGPISGCSADINADGNPDVVSVGGNGVVWYQSDGLNPPGWTARTVQASWLGLWVETADMDRDGDMDIVAGSADFADELAWFENNGATPPGWTKRSIETSMNSGSNGWVGDIDGDGDVDIIAFSDTAGSNHLRLYLNNGSQTFSRHMITAAPASYFFDVAVADLDGNGRLDILFSDYFGGVRWLGQQSHAKVQALARTDSNATPTTTYLGPDGTAKTFYGSGAGVKETNGANLNRYGQYKATLYRNDTTLDPMIKDVRLDYTALAYSTANPYVQPATGTAITYLTSFAETLSGALPAGTAVKYTLSPNSGTNWYYHNGTNWVTSDGTYAQSAAASVISANIAGFDDKAYADVTLPENSTGTLLWRAFFNSDGSATPQLDQIDVGYEAGAITVTAPNGSDIWKVGSAKNITWTTTGVVPDDLTLEYATDGAVFSNTIATGVAGSGAVEKDPATISGAVGVWRFNGNANDTSGNGYNGTVSGATYVAGKYGNALQFDGVDDYASVPSFNLSGTNVVTVSFWLYWNAYVENDDLAMEFTPNYNSNNGFAVDLNATYGPGGVANAGIGPGSGNHRIEHISRPSAAAWHHHAIVLTRNAGGDSIDWYVDGGLVTTTVDIAGAHGTNFANDTLYLMSRAGTSLFGAGKLDDVAIYNRALTATEIKDLAGGGAYAWPVPNAVGNQVKVRIRSAGVPAIRDASNANFTIADLNVSAPNGAEFWKVGTTQNITWTKAGAVPDDLVLEYTTDGAAYTSIATALNATTGTPYAWTVPAGAISATTKVRVRSASATELADASNANFTAYALALTAPNGAESWPAGSSQTITWTHNGLPGTTVKLEYSTDGGLTWVATAIATAVAKSAATGCTAPVGGGCYNWTLPSSLSTTARVRVTDEFQAAVTDASDANFTISGTILSVTAPISTDVWPVTTTQTIKWSNDGPIPTGGTVKLSYSADNGSTWTTAVGGDTVDATTGATGFSWGVPLNAASSTAKIKVEDNPVWSPNAVDGTSAAYKVSALVTVNFPNGGEKWAAGSAHNIKWQTTGTLANVDILADLDNNGVFETTLFTNLTNDGVEAWTPTGAQASAAAKIRVQSATDATIGDNSNATFKVSTVAVTAPNAAGVRWLAGSGQTITWTSTGVTNVALDYSTDNGANWTAIAASTLSDGTEPWTAANKTSIQALIRVRDADAATGNEAGDTALAGDNSDNAFAIYGTITVTAPNATGITWASGAPQTITWTVSPANANVVPNVKITITDLINAANNKTVTASTNGQNVGAGSGSYSWSPDFTTTSAKIKVEDAADANSNDQSDNAFAIEGIAISAPAGSESWLVGSSQNVQFSWSGTVTSVKLEYSIDNGSAWSAINASWSPPANPATFSWTIPDAIASAAVKVRVTSNNNPGVVATSNAFTITGALAMATPATLTVGQSATVSWTKTGTIGTVKVEFSPAGTFADTLVTVGTGLTGTSTTWTVPDNIGTTGKLRVTDTVAGHPATTGTSNAFAIAGDFAFTAPISTTAWGVAESQAITWTSSGTMGTVKIEYATDADSYAAWTTITASTTNAGTYTWNPIPDLVGGTPNPPSPISAPTNGKRNVKVRLTDAAHSGTAQVVKSSSAFTVKWHLITFNVQNEDGSFLAALNVTDDATAWSVADASLVSPSSTKRQYKYGTVVTTTWSKANFTAKTDSFTVTGDATRTITLLSENPEPYEITWSPFHNSNTDAVTATIFLTRRGQLIIDTANLSAGKIYIYSGTTLKATLTGSGPSSATGEYTFSFTAGTYGLTAGNSYFVKTEIVYGGTSKFGAGVLPITLPTDTQTVLTRLGAVGDASSANTLFGKLAGLNTLVGATGDASGTSTLFGKMADVKTTLGSSTDTGTTTVFGKVAAVKDILGTTSDTGTTTVFGKLKQTETNTEIAAQTGILTRESSVKTGNTIDIQYRTTTGLSPKVDVYDAKGKKVVSGRTMTEIATTGIYEDPLTLDKSWGTGDFTVLVSESTKGSNDSMILSVLGTDLETIGKKPSGASTAADTTPIMNELRNLRGLMGMTAAQGSLMGQMGQIQQQMSALQAQLGLLGVSEEGDKKGKVQPTIRDQIAEIAKILKSVSGEEGESLATLYDVSEATTKNVKAMQNKVEQIKRAAEVTQKIVEEGRQKVVVQTWFESGSVILKILVVNPTDEPQEVPVKAYLPKEVKPEHVIDKGELNVEFDPDKTAYFVATTAKLAPKESVVYGIEVEDIWVIPQEKLTAISDEAKQAFKQLQETEYAEKAALLASQIDLKLAQIWERQSDPTLTPERHIQVHRENLQALELLEADVAMLKRMVASIVEPGAKSMAGDFLGKAFSGVTANWGDAAGSAGTKYSPSTAMTWRLIFGILAFLGLLSLAAFMLWQHQAQIQIKSDAIALQQKKPEDSHSQVEAS